MRRLSRMSSGDEAGDAAGDGELAHADTGALGPQATDGEERLGGGRRRSVAVGPLGGDVVHVGQGGDAREASVRLEAQVLAGDVVARAGARRCRRRA